MGDTKQGRALALDSNSPQLCKECAQILESQDKQQVIPDMRVCCQLHLEMTWPCRLNVQKELKPPAAIIIVTSFAPMSSLR